MFTHLVVSQDFGEFVFHVWNICSLDGDGLILFVFDLYDVDGSGQLSKGEVKQILLDVSTNSHPFCFITCARVHGVLVCTYAGVWQAHVQLASG